jgi:hypothetical protein
MDYINAVVTDKMNLLKTISHLMQPNYLNEKSLLMVQPILCI